MTTKKNFFTILTTVLLLSLSSLPSFGQHTLSFGFRLNPNFSALNNKNDKDAGPNLNYATTFNYLSFGFGANYSFNNHTGIALDILFSREGQSFDGTLHGNADVNNDADYSSTVQFQSALADETIDGDYEALAEPNFIKIPVMFMFTSDNSKKVFFDLTVGPQLNFLQGVAQEINGVDYEYPNTNLEIKDIYKKLTLDGMIGIGAGYNLSDHFLLTTQLRFDYGFSDLENKDLMFSYKGQPEQKYYSSSRASTHNTTSGLFIGLNYKL